MPISTTQYDRRDASSVDVDVLVVGAGPVGRLLAAELVLGGASVDVVERSREPADTIKAGSINLASAEILARRGLAGAARQIHERTAAPIAELFAQRDPELDFSAAHELVSRRLPRAGHFAGIALDAELVDDDDVDVAAHRDLLGATLVPQREIEALLGEHAERLGVTVRRGVAVTGIAQTDDAVIVDTDAGEVRARWVVGCDGGRSLVRHQLDLEFPGTDPEITGHQAIVELEDDSVLSPGWNATEDGVYRYGPMPGVILTVEFDGPPVDRDRSVSVDELQRSLRRTSQTKVTITGMHGEATRWTDNARQATTYRVGRVLLAGDAAHVHSPFSGQGLNLGLGDATNLGWKLAATVTGRAPSDLLDTYDAERHPVGEWVLDWTRAQVALMRPEVKARQARAIVADLMRSPAGMTRIVNQTSGIMQRVELPGDHPLTGRLVPDLVLTAGRSLRGAFAGGQFVLLDRSRDHGLGDVVAAWGERIVVVRDDAPADPVALLARPDGVVIWAAGASDPVDPGAMCAALRRWAGSPGA